MATTVNNAFAEFMKEKVFAEVQGRKIELSKLTKKKRDAKPEQIK